MRLLSFFLILHLTLVNAVSPVFAHAAVGCATGSISSNDCTGGAAGDVAGEIAAELFVTNWTKSVLKRAQAGELTRQELANEIASLDSKAINIASLTGGLMAALVGGDVNVGSAAGSNAAEYNALCGGICIGLIATIIGYMTYSGDGDPSEGLAVMGSGDDPLSVAVAAGTSAAVEWSAIEFPETTQAILSILEVTGGAIDATVTYVDDATGNEVSRRWNEIPEHTRNQIKGGGKIISIFVPAGSIKALKQLKNAKRAGNRTVTQIDDLVDLTDFRSVHILNRHRSGAGISGKTEFPSNWDDQRILHQISDVATDPALTRVTRVKTH